MKQIKLIPFLATAGLMSLFAASCVFTQSSGDESISETRTIAGDFNRIEVDDAIRVLFSQGDTLSVYVEAAEDVLPKIHPYVEGETLKIERKGRNIRNGGKVTVYVTCPNIRSIEVDGASSFIAETPVTVEKLELDVDGASKVSFDKLSVASDIAFDVDGASSVSAEISARSVLADVDGASKLKLTGTAERAVFDADGASRIEAKELSVEEASAEADGASSVNVNAKAFGSLEASGASSITCYSPAGQEPMVRHQKAHRSSSIKFR